MRISRDLLRFCLIPLVLIVGVLLAVFFTGYYTTTLRTERGVISARQPMDLTRSFAREITLVHGQPAITEAGVRLLESNGLWLQILDEEGTAIYACRVPDGVPKRYAPQALLNAYQSGVGDFSVFVGVTTLNGQGVTYLMGFPLRVSKSVVYMDTARYATGKTLILCTGVLTVLTFLGLIWYYNATLIRHYERIRQALTAIAQRTYRPSSPGRFLREIDQGLDQLNGDIEAADALRMREERAKEEWLANITHDLKTPLSPIRGYAELLKAAESGLSQEQARRYGDVLVKNVAYAQQLVDDLRLTYQLKSGMLPLNASQGNWTRFVREIVIDVMNMPEFHDHQVSFASDSETTQAVFDPLLMKRALNNILVNALTHGGEEVAVSVVGRQDGRARVVVRDNGIGMSKDDLDRLFSRYYRGGSTDQKIEGTGLGMAIAKQIVEAQGGTITAESAKGAGTEICIALPSVN